MYENEKHKTKPRVIITRRTLTLFIIGFLLISVPSLFYLNEGIQLAFFTPKVPVITVVKKFAAPVSIQIPDVRINLPVEETVINHGVWQIARNSISHLSTSARPGEKGPIVLYGHNTNDRFGPIRWLKEGGKISVTTSGGIVHSYTIYKTLDISPNDTNIFNQSSETLILYTCDGFADLQRFVVLAKPSK